MNLDAFQELIGAFWAELNSPAIFWQAMAVAGCALLGAWLAHKVRGTFAKESIKKGAFGIRNDRLSRILTPLCILLMLVVIRPFLAGYYGVNLLNLAIPLIGSLALIRVIFHVLQRAFDSEGKSGALLQLSEKVFATIVWIGLALYITGWWPELIAYLDTTVVPLGRNKISLLAILQAIASVIVTLLAALWAGAALEDRLMRVETVHSSFRAVMARVGRAVLIVAALLISLSLVGIDLTVLSIFGGALGVGLGLGLQKIASNYVSGFVILLERSMAIGDMIGVDKYYGMVTQIKTRYTVLRALDGVESVVPNEMFVSSPVQNYSLSDRSVRLSTNLVVGYETDLERLLPLLSETVSAITRVSKGNAPVALLSKFGVNGLEIEVGFWIDDPENGRLNVSSDVNRAIWRLLKAEDVKIPYPQQEVRVIGGLPAVEASVMPIQATQK